MRGESRSGHALPFGSAIGFTIMTSMVCSGANPTSLDTSVRIASRRSAARIAHASYADG
jgi:hypothetical protein